MNDNLLIDFIFLYSKHTLGIIKQLAWINILIILIYYLFINFSIFDMDYSVRYECYDLKYWIFDRCSNLFIYEFQTSRINNLNIVSILLILYFLSMLVNYLLTIFNIFNSISSNYRTVIVFLLLSSIYAIYRSILIYSRSNYYGTLTYFNSIVEYVITSIIYFVLLSLIISIFFYILINDKYLNLPILIITINIINTLIYKMVEFTDFNLYITANYQHLLFICLCILYVLYNEQTNRTLFISSLFLIQKIINIYYCNNRYLLFLFNSRLNIYLNFLGIFPLVLFYLISSVLQLMIDLFPLESIVFQISQTIAFQLFVYFGILLYTYYFIIQHFYFRNIVIKNIQQKYFFIYGMYLNYSEILYFKYLIIYYNIFNIISLIIFFTLSLLLLSYTIRDLITSLSDFVSLYLIIRIFFLISQYHLLIINKDC